MLWLLRSVEVDLVHEAVSDVVLVGEVCDHPREVAAVGAETSLLTLTEAEPAFPAASVCAAVKVRVPSASELMLTVVE